MLGALAQSNRSPLPQRPNRRRPQAFAAAWQDQRHLLVGTKCNRLVQWDVLTGGLRDVPLPPAPAREHPVTETLWGSCGARAACLAAARWLG